MNKFGFFNISLAYFCLVRAKQSREICPKKSRLLPVFALPRHFRIINIVTHLIVNSNEIKTLDYAEDIFAPPSSCSDVSKHTFPYCQQHLYKVCFHSDSQI